MKKWYFQTSEDKTVVSHTAFKKFRFQQILKALQNLKFLSKMIWCIVTHKFFGHDLISIVLNFEGNSPIRKVEFLQPEKSLATLVVWHSSFLPGNINQEFLLIYPTKIYTNSTLYNTIFCAIFYDNLNLLIGK